MYIPHVLYDCFYSMYIVVFKDTDGKAKAKAKDLTLKAKAKDTSHKAKAKAKEIQHKPKSVPWRPFPMEGRHARELVLAHQTCDKNAPLALLHLRRMGTNWHL